MDHNQLVDKYVAVIKRYNIFPDYLMHTINAKHNQNFNWEECEEFCIFICTNNLLDKSLEENIILWKLYKEETK